MENILNEEEIEHSIDKIKLYNGQEELNFENIKQALEQMKYHYRTKNADTLNVLHDNCAQKLAILIKIHNNNIEVLNKNLRRYKDTKFKVEKLFEELG